jgi:hypothetical protein
MARKYGCWFDPLECGAMDSSGKVCAWTRWLGQGWVWGGRSIVVAVLCGGLGGARGEEEDGCAEYKVGRW